MSDAFLIDSDFFIGSLLSMFIEFLYVYFMNYTKVLYDKFIWKVFHKL